MPTRNGREQHKRYQIEEPWMTDAAPYLIERTFFLTKQYAWEIKTYGRERTHMATFNNMAKTPAEALAQYRQMCDQRVMETREQLTADERTADRARKAHIHNERLIFP